MRGSSKAAVPTIAVIRSTSATVYPRTAIFNPRAKGLLPWKFRVLEKMVEDEWVAYKKRMAARGDKLVTISKGNYAERDMNSLGDAIDVS